MLELRPIPGWSAYLAGSDGRIYTSHRPGAPALMVGHINRDGYPQVSLRVPGRKNSKRFPVHRLVALAFHGAGPPGAVIRHLNGVRSDNVPGNLAWGSAEENGADARRHGSRAGARNPRAKIQPMEVDEIRFAYRRGAVSQETLARLHGIGQTQVSRIVRGECWNR